MVYRAVKPKTAVAGFGMLLTNKYSTPSLECSPRRLLSCKPMAVLEALFHFAEKVLKLKHRHNPYCDCNPSHIDAFFGGLDEDYEYGGLEEDYEYVQPFEKFDVIAQARDSLSSRMLEEHYNLEVPGSRSGICLDEDNELLADLLSAIEQHLVQEQERRRRAALPKVKCAICLDDFIEEEIAIFGYCGHQFCKECMRGYVISKINARCYPIVCPTCMTDREQEDVGVLDEAALQQIELSDEQEQKFVELQLTSYAVKVHCRRCDQECFVDRVDYDATDVIECPVGLGCTFTWCKACSLEVSSDGPTHSCDGTNELDYLMQQHGWKRCPGCRTPAEKISGCNHMTCTVPGCNMHFCYQCGKAIIRTLRVDQIYEALDAHMLVCGWQAE
ncbi:hypothetical protein WOLCODRAFT_14646 [Wolfiporia cocos MD-104 SS10]|uniref:RBR-type E3 ubiquitin transferase n=1 Tax=Wolfiporia cocos (strain MD-104) TaxID=742152 RepID=A0A2H3ITN9_WOLCO|nr:hypothetical protein WOLCODRAFT_14646 [Wolfiporia cocos MD-104 SS10]